MFCLVKGRRWPNSARPQRKSHPGMGRKSPLKAATESTDPASTRHMKRYSSSLVGTSLRIGFLVGLALILILILLPAAIAAQAASLG